MNIKKSSETFKVIAKYLKESLDIEPKKITYVGTHSSNGLTPIIHYDIEYVGGSEEWPYTKLRTVRATVYWNNDVPVNALPTITRMDVM